jgi:transposase-like protein
MDDLSRFCCQNADCPLYGQRSAGNLSVCDRHGKHQQIRLLYCTACKARFSERKGTPRFQSCLPQETAVSVLQHLVEGDGVRQTERLTGVHRDTVMRLARLAGPHTQGTHDELVAFSPRDSGLEFCYYTARRQNKIPGRHFGDRNARHDLRASRASGSRHDVVVTTTECRSLGKCRGTRGSA